MPELPEVQTVVDGLEKKIIGKKIKDIWTDYRSSFYYGKENIKDPKYFSFFKKALLGKKILSAKRVGKNILLETSGEYWILIHLKMTGHLLFGEYFLDKKENKVFPKGGFLQRKSKDFEKEVLKNPLRDPFNAFIHLLFVFEKSKKSLALSDMRKFATVKLVKKELLGESFQALGPDALKISFKDFYKIFKDKKGKVKPELMKPENISGIGNIYSDEILFASGVHPESLANKIPKEYYKKMFSVMKRILKKSISCGGDSMSDFRNIEGKKGEFQKKHKVYKREGWDCLKKDCKGKISKKVISGRGSRFCSACQKKFL